MIEFILSYGLYCVLVSLIPLAIVIKSERAEDAKNESERHAALAETKEYFTNIIDGK